MQYTLKVTVTDEGATTAEVTGTTLTSTVVELGHWTATTPDEAISTAADHGWVPVRKPRAGTTQITVTPTDMLAHATDVVRLRQQAQVAADQWNDAFNDLIATMPPPGDPLYVSAIDLARISGLQRQRIHNIRREHLAIAQSDQSRT